MLRFKPRGQFYRCAEVVSDREGALTLSVIEPPVRNPGVSAFDEFRLRKILSGIASESAMPPIEIFATANRRYRYRVHDGYHRFYASAAAGFPCIPIKIVEPAFQFECDPIPRS